MAKFCEKCGKPLGDAQNCPHCNGKKHRAKTKRSKRILTILLIVLSVYTALLITGGILVYFDKLSIPFINDLFLYTGLKDGITAPAPDTETPEEAAAPEETPENSLSEPYRVTPPDAKEVYDQTATVLDTVLARESSQVQGEAATYDALADRGFADGEILSLYDMSGAYGEFVISASSSEKHPMYQTEYRSATGMYWQIFAINGSVFASPISYTLEQEGRIPVMLSETDTLTGYDGTTNAFYIFKPNAEVLSLKTVQKIDAQTLDALTEGGVDAL